MRRLLKIALLLVVLRGLPRPTSAMNPVEARTGPVRVVVVNEDLAFGAYHVAKNFNTVVLTRAGDPFLVAGPAWVRYTNEVGVVLESQNSDYPTSFWEQVGYDGTFIRSYRKYPVVAVEPVAVVRTGDPVLVESLRLGQTVAARVTAVEALQYSFSVDYPAAAGDSGSLVTTPSHVFAGFVSSALVSGGASVGAGVSFPRTVPAALPPPAPDPIPVPEPPAVTGGNFINLVDAGVRQDGLESSAQANLDVINAALGSGRTLWLPPAPLVAFVGPGPVRATVGTTNLTLRLDGDISRPSATAWPNDNVQAFLSFSEGTQKNLHIEGSGTIFGNSRNQPGKEDGIRIDGGQDVVVKDLHLGGFGAFAIFVGSSTNVQLTGLTIRQLNGSTEPAARWGFNSDGIHGYDVSDVLMDRCIIWSTDDGAAFTQRENKTSRRIRISNCIFHPVAATSTPNKGLRIGNDTVCTNAWIRDVSVSGCIFNCVGGAGIIIGTQAGAGRFVTGVQISDCMINNALVDSVTIGPNYGTVVDPGTDGGITIMNAGRVTVRGCSINSARNAGINLANVELCILTDDLIQNIYDGGRSWPRGGGIMIWQDLPYGPVDELVIDSVRISDTDGPGIYGAGRYTPGRVKITNSAILRTDRLNLRWKDLSQ